MSGTTAAGSTSSGGAWTSPCSIWVSAQNSSIVGSWHTVWWMSSSPLQVSVSFAGGLAGYDLIPDDAHGLGAIKQWHETGSKDRL